VTSSTRESIRKTTGDPAHIVISTDYNRYRMSAMSA
jgi:hypothetical protein